MSKDILEKINSFLNEGSLKMPTGIKKRATGTGSTLVWTAGYDKFGDWVSGIEITGPVSASDLKRAYPGLSVAVIATEKLKKGHDIMEDRHGELYVDFGGKEDDSIEGYTIDDEGDIIGKEKKFTTTNKVTVKFHDDEDQPWLSVE